MKRIRRTAIVLAAVLAALYVTAFTGIGNRLIAPLVEKKIADALQIPVSLSTFVLRPDRFEVLLDITPDNTVEAAGSFSLLSRTVHARYRLSLGDPYRLRPLTGMTLKGRFDINGTVEGDERQLRIDGSSDIAGSDTSFSMRLENLAPRSTVIDIKHMQLDELLYTLGRPKYARGEITLNTEIKDLREAKLDGTVALDIRNGIADRQVISKAFDLSRFKGARFGLTSRSRLHGNIVDATASFDSDLIRFKADSLRYLVNRQQLTSEYTATVPDLDRLYFLTKRPLRGAATVTGDLRYEKTLLLHAHSDILGGRIDATLDDSALHADLTSLRTLKALDMLIYPPVFDAKLDGTLDYDTATKKGVLDTQLSDGRFTRNSIFDLLRRYSTLDLYEERFNGTLRSQIDAARLDSDLLLKSKRASITARHALFDTDTKRIDASVHVDANNNPIDFRIRGSIEDPAVDISADELIEREAGKQINRLLNHLFR